MQIEELKTFVAVADLKSFTKAAAVLKIAQPTVSLHIKNLEAGLQTPLLQRTSRTVHVTPAGQLLYDRALQLIDLADRTKSEVARPQQTLTGTLRIASSPVIAESILPDVLTRIHAKFPEIRLRVEVMDAVSVNIAVRKKQADIGCSETAGAPDARPFMENELLLTAAAGHSLARKKGASILDLQDAHWILPDEDEPVRELIDQSLAQYGVQPEYTVIGSPEGRKQAVLSGLGIAILSRLSCRRELERGELAILNYKVAPLRQPFYSHTGRKTPASDAFLDELDAYCRLWTV